MITARIDAQYMHKLALKTQEPWLKSTDGKPFHIYVQVQQHVLNSTKMAPM